MDCFIEIIETIDQKIWGPGMLFLLLGTGIFLTIRYRFLPWRNLLWALRVTLSKESRRMEKGRGDVSPFSALTTALAATIGTGNIVGVATAMTMGGPGVLVWMWISACFGFSSKLSECMLAIKYREKEMSGKMSGGPMYTMKKALANKKLGSFLAAFFSLSTVIASFGIGNMTQGNSIAVSMHTSFGTSISLVGILLSFFCFLIILGGIQMISKVSSVIVPLMAGGYVLCGFLVLVGNFKNLPEGLCMIFEMAFSAKAVSGALCGTMTSSVMDALRYGVSRGIFSNEAGMGSAAITAASASASHPVRQGYINMTGTFWDTIVVCTVTGMVIACSGVLGQINPETGACYDGAALTIAAFSTILGNTGEFFVTIGIVLFAFSTILGWEYQGEKAFAYLLGTQKYDMIYRVLFSLAVYIGATQTLELVWGFSDIANALMAIPNLICLLLLSKETAQDIKEYQKVIDREKTIRKVTKKRREKRKKNRRQSCK